MINEREKLFSNGATPGRREGNNPRISEIIL